MHRQTLVSVSECECECECAVCCLLNGTERGQRASPSAKHERARSFNIKKQSKSSSLPPLPLRTVVRGAEIG